MATLAAVLAEARKNGRVCPKPGKWNDLYKLLPDTKRKGVSWEPSPPLILAAWWDTPDELKMSRLRTHIEWASKHGALDAVYTFLLTLNEDDWHHLDD